MKNSGLERPFGRGSEKPEEEEEEEWEEEEEEEGEEEWEEEEEEEEEEDAGEEEGEKKKKDEAKTEGKDEKKEKPGKEPSKESKAKDEKKGAGKKAEKPAGEAKAKEPSEPADPLKTAKILFVAGICLFFLSTCAHKSHGQKTLKYSYLSDYYSGKARKPIQPAPPYRQTSVNPNNEEKAKEQKEFNEKYNEAAKKYVESEAYKDFLVKQEKWNQWVHEHQVDLAEAARGLAGAKSGVGNWARFWYYFGNLGILLMIAGLILFAFIGDKYEKIAAFLVLGLGILPLLSGTFGSWLSGTG